MPSSQKTSNLPTPIQPIFTPDDLSLIIGTCLPEAVAVLDPATGKLVGGNQRLEEYIGLPLTEPAAAEIPFQSLIHPDDLPQFKELAAVNFAAVDGTIEFRLRSRNGDIHAVEVLVSNLRWRRQEFLLLYIRTIPERQTTEQELKDKIYEQKKKTLEAVKSSLLIYQFTEKIKKTPNLTTSLLSMVDETEMFERAARILTCEGLNYKEVSFFLLRDDHLEVCYSTQPLGQRQFPLSDDNKYCRFIREDCEGSKTLESEILVPLRSRGVLLGIVEVTLHPRERVFFDEFNLLSEWQKDTLLTIGDMIALLLDNLRLNREIKRQSVIDPLTGVYNRNYFVNRLSTEINRCTRLAYPISLIFIDVDQFKSINDTYGHVQGDQILRELGALFRGNLREYDCVCRYGGDEFVVLLPEVGELQAQSIAEKILQVVREHNFYSVEHPDKKLPVSISLGVSVLNRGMEENHFLKSADSALYQAKKMGRNQMVVSKTAADAKS